MINAVSTLRGISSFAAVRWRKLAFWQRIVILIGVLALIAWIAIPGSGSDLPTARVRTGAFVTDLKETGRLKAENSVTVTSPPVRITLQIVDLVPEGTVVEAGDLLIQFDTTELKQVIDDRLAELDIERANLTRSLAAMESHMASLKSALENSLASHRLAELSLDKMKFEADVRLEEGNLNLKQAEISLRQAEQQVKAQKQINSADIRTLELKIRQARIDLEKSYRDLAKMRILAPAPGLVVHKEIWKGGQMAKVKVGDTPWRGQALIELPDLSVMMVETTVSEIDISKVEVGQEVEVKLDAYPEPTFHGEVVDVAILASVEEGISEAKVFELLVRIRESDPLLRPGMSASARIIVDRIPDKMWVPIEAIFNHDGEKVVWEAVGSGFKRCAIVLGGRNDNFVIVESGLDEDAEVALVDPSIASEERPAYVKPEGDTNEISSNTGEKSKPTRSGKKRRPRRH